MFPFFEIFSNIKIYSFGLFLIICFILFLWMLKKLKTRFNYNLINFYNPKVLVLYFLSIFIFSRIFYVISKWTDLKYIRDPLEFFIMNDYNFSLIGAIIGFFVVLFINLKYGKNKPSERKLDNYIDGIVISFIFVLFVGYIGAFLGGQVYGRETTYGIELLYSHPHSPVPFEVPIFPLAIIYSISFFILFSLLYITSTFINIKGLLGYIGIASFACIILIFEFFSGKYDIFKDNIGINMNQFFAIFLIIFAGYKLYKIIIESEKSK